MSTSVSPAQARRIALAAQGFGRPAAARSRAARPGIRQLNLEIDRLGLLQLDSVNVFERSHYLPLFARLGPYDRSDLDRLIFSRGGRYIEYWAHEAAVIPITLWPMLRWRMDGYGAKHRDDQTHWSQSNGPMIDWLMTEIRERGPMPASAIEHESNRRVGPWWGWSEVKTGLEVLFREGRLVSGGRARFERVYALPEQVIPDELLGVSVSRADAQLALVEHSLTAHGIGTASDIADYFRLRNDDTLAALRTLEETGAAVPVEVAGWGRRAWMHRDARLPRRIETAALLSPFDPVVWERDRAERMFGFRYRIEIYTPAPKRVFGYYSLPILLDDALVGRIDLKSDRQNGVLRVQSAWTEADAPADTAARIAPVLRSAATWQGLDDIEVMGRGDLSGSLSGALSAELRG